MTDQLALLPWRGRTLVDAYLRLHDGRAGHKEATESYVDLCKTRGLPLPITTTGWDLAGPECGLRGELYRLSSDSAIFHKHGWNIKRPDWFKMYDRGMWGLREEVFDLLKPLNIEDPSPVLVPEIIVPDFSLQKLYLMQNKIPYLPQEKIVIKVGISQDPHIRRNTLQTGNPYPIEVIFVTQCSGTGAFEKRLHNLLQPFRIQNGGEEWFELTYTEFVQIYAKALLDHTMRR